MIKLLNTQPTAAAGARRASIVGLLLFVALVASALYWAKWGPYWTKGFTVAAKHTLGSSILSGTAVAPPEPSVTAAVTYAISYFKAIWTALVAGLLMAAGVEALVPRRWLLRALSPGRGPMGSGRASKSLRPMKSDSTSSLRITRTRSACRMA